MKIKVSNKKYSILFVASIVIVIIIFAIIRCASGNKQKSAHDLIASNISNKTFVLHVGNNKIFPYQGGKSKINIVSYSIDKNNNKVPVPWSISFSLDNGKTWGGYLPEWLDIDNFTGKGGIIPQTNNVAARRNSSAKDSIIVFDYNLATKGGTAAMTTANCYIVNVPGTYKFPLVYGNAIKNGNDNKIAYQPEGKNSGMFLTPFKNHLGEGIKKPWLKDNGVKVNKAKLLWQDSPNMITNISVKDEYVYFTVPDNAMTGNAVIAALDNKTVCWSWHIWITQETLNEPMIIGSTEQTFSIAPVNLGWTVDNKKLVKIEKKRSVIMRIKQDNLNGKYKDIVIQQLGFKNDNDYGKYSFCPYYQWGRKDPEIPSAINGINPRKAYDHKNDTVSNYYAVAKNIEQSIQFPMIHLSAKNEVSGERQNNLWNAAAENLRDRKTVKTVYDPCPPGYCVPSEAFYVFISENGEHEWHSKPNGQLWFMGSTKIFFPAIGIREASIGKISNFKEGSKYWSSNSKYQKEYSCLSITSGSFVMESGFKQEACPIRPMKEN